MRSLLPLTAALTLLAPLAFAAPEAVPDSGRALTIYNQNFAVVRQTVPLDLKAGVNHVTVSDITYHLEPDSVVLRDPSGKRTLQIREQNYRADPISQELLLSLYEGQTIDFQVQHGDQTSVVSGKIIRSGYVPHTEAYSTFGYQYQQAQQGYAYGAAGQPIIEVAGKLQFSLPGIPLFPALSDDSILQPTLDWQIVTDRAGPLSAELAYITGGMTWKADYNVVSPEVGDMLDLTGWVTLDNETGKTFENAHIKLMAGDVSKLQAQEQNTFRYRSAALASLPDLGTPTVTEKAFDEYHLYSLANPTTLRDREIKQVEFTRAANVASKVIYVYDGVQIDPNQYNGWDYNNIRNQPPPPLPPDGPPGINTWPYPSLPLPSDSSGAGWINLEGDVYKTWRGLWAKQTPLSAPGSPFQDGRSIEHVYTDPNGRLFFLTRPAGQYALVSWQPPVSDAPHAPSVQVISCALDSVSLRFTSASAVPHKILWRINDGEWKHLPGTGTVRLTDLPHGNYRVEAQAVDDLLQVSPQPAVAVFSIRPASAGQIERWVQTLVSGTDDAREQAAAGLVKQGAPALPALQAARPGASEAAEWWLEAVTAQIAPMSAGGQTWAGTAGPAPN